jgi:hypothetical protein
VICGSEDIERNHVGGRNHIAWFTIPLCRSKHHRQFHALVTAAGINLEYTSDPRERLGRAQKATMVFQWMLLEAQQELNSREKDENTREH